MKKNFTQVLSYVLVFFAFTANAQVVYEFTTAGATGQNGPSQAQVNSTYNSTNLQGAVTVSSGIQEWTVPSTGFYSIEVHGAKGADDASYDGGEGATVYGEFLLQGGDVFEILVGQEGVDGNTGASGGGGGSFVVKQAGNVPLAIAGGGSGATSNGPDGNPGQAANNGANGDNCAGNGGINGNGGGASGSCGNGAGGAGGFLSDGLSNSNWGTCKGIGYNNGGSGGLSQYGGAVGGFGGGAGTHTNNLGGGAGGGYSGGGAPYHGNGYSGGGGGSYNDGSNQTNTIGGNNGPGLVIITPLSSPAPNNIGVATFLSPDLVSNLICRGTYNVDVILQNFGSNQITMADVDWTIDGIAQPTFAYTGLLDTFGGTFSTADTVTIGTITLTEGVELIGWTAMPNGNNDTININDTTTFMIDSVIDLNFSLGPDRAICDGAFVVLKNEASNETYDDYDWSTGASSSSIAVNTPGTYSVTVTEGAPNCIASDEIVITTSSNPTVDIGTSIESCGQAIIDAQNAGSNYTWSNGDTTQIITVENSGTYSVSVTTAVGCFGTDEVDVVINPNPDLTLGSDFEICIDDGGATTIGPINNPNYTYLWSNNKTTSQILIGLPTASPGNKTFWLEVTDGKGCMGSDTVNIRFKNCIVAGIGSVDQSEAWVVYPTPTDGPLMIDLSFEATNVEMNLFNINGEFISTVYNGNVTGTKQVPVDFSSLASGVYVLKLQSDEFTSSKQIMIQH